MQSATRVGNRAKCQQTHSHVIQPPPHIWSRGIDLLPCICKCMQTRRGYEPMQSPWTHRLFSVQVVSQLCVIKRLTEVSPHMWPAIEYMAMTVYRNTHTASGFVIIHQGFAD